MRRCLLVPESVSRDELAELCRGCRGIVFLGLRGESVPYFIVDAAAELERVGVVGRAVPCSVFSRSFLVDSEVCGSRDLVLLTRRIKLGSKAGLEQWVREQCNRMVIFLRDYVMERIRKDINPSVPRPE